MTNLRARPRLNLFLCDVVVDFYDGRQVFVFPGEDFVFPALIALRGDAGDVVGGLSVGLGFLEFVDEFPLLHFHGAFGESALRADIPKHDGVLLRVPGVEAVDVGHRFAVRHELVADADGLAVLGPGELGVDLHFLAIG